MSTYVFGIIGTFLLTLSAIQLLAISHIEDKISEEISSRSEFISNKALDFIVTGQSAGANVKNDTSQLSGEIEEIVSNFVFSAPDSASQDTDKNTQRQTVKILENRMISTEKITTRNNDDGGDSQASENPTASQRPDTGSNREGSYRTSENRQIHIDDNTLIESVTSIRLGQGEDAGEIVERLRKGLSEIRIERRNNDSFVLFAPSSSLKQSSVFTINTEESRVKAYFRYLTFATLGIGILSLLFAFWLARHLTAPLSSLAHGFKQLRDGNLGFQLAPTGVKEVKQTVQAFNQTSRRLEELQQMESQFSQQQQLAELGEISRGMAHSLRNPLNTIGLALEEMTQGNIDSAQRRSLAANARQKINALDRTIKSLLMLTTSGVDRTHNVLLNDVIQDAAMQMSMGESCDIQLQLQQSVVIKGSEAELSAVIMSLLSNAVEASSEKASIKIQLSTDNSMALLSIIDDGEGLDDVIAQQLFQPHITSKPEGAGMGLYIAKRILNHHYKGELTLKNNAGKGCIATLMFQCLRIDEVERKDEG